MEEEKKIFELAAKLGFKNFTELQRKIFSDEKFYDVSKRLFVLGATSSGKTLVALMAYFFEKFDLRDLNQKSKLFLQDVNIKDIFVKLFSPLDSRVK